MRGDPATRLFTRILPGLKHPRSRAFMRVATRLSSTAMSEPTPDQPASEGVQQVQLLITLRADGRCAISGPIDNLPLTLEILKNGILALIQHSAGKSDKEPPRIVVPNVNVRFGGKVN